MAIDGRDGETGVGKVVFIDNDVDLAFLVVPEMETRTAIRYRPQRRYDERRYDGDRYDRRHNDDRRYDHRRSRSRSPLGGRDGELHQWSSSKHQWRRDEEAPARHHHGHHGRHFQHFRERAKRAPISGKGRPIWRAGASRSHPRHAS